jgi:hypothetical protein
MQKSKKPKDSNEKDEASAVIVPVTSWVRKKKRAWMVMLVLVFDGFK